MGRDWHRNCYAKRAMSNTTQTHKLNGFTLTLSHDGETIHANIEKGKYSGSLSMAENNGCIENEDWTKCLNVPDSVVEAFQELEERFSESL
jgi:hypothetical protein